MITRASLERSVTIIQKAPNSHKNPTNSAKAPIVMHGNLTVKDPQAFGNPSKEAATRSTDMG